MRLRYQPKSRFAIAQEPRNFLLKGIRVADLDRGFIDYQSLSERGEILHVRTKKNGFASEDWFDRILSAARRQALADKYYGGGGVPMLQFAGGIEEKAIGRRTARAA